MLRIIDVAEILGVTHQRVHQIYKLGRRPEPAFLVEELSRHVAAFSNPDDRDALLFPGPEGGFMRLTNWRKRTFYPACKRAGIDPMPHPHDLRHTSVPLAIEAGASALGISRMLGHGSIKITYDRYGHILPETGDHDAERLDALYRAASRTRKAWASASSCRALSVMRR